MRERGEREVGGRRRKLNEATRGNGKCEIEIEIIIREGRTSICCLR